MINLSNMNKKTQKIERAYITPELKKNLYSLVILIDP